MASTSSYPAQEASLLATALQWQPAPCSWPTSSGKILWSFKADIFCVAVQLLVESGGDRLAFLSNLAKSFRPIQLRKNEFGANIGATTKGSKGGEFEVNIVQYSVAVLSTPATSRAPPLTRARAPMKCSASFTPWSSPRASHRSTSIACVRTRS